MILSGEELAANLHVNHMTDLFTAHDGGVAFVKLRHHMIPEFLKSDDQNAKKMLEALTLVNRLCGVLLGKVVD